MFGFERKIPVTRSSDLRVEIRGLEVIKDDLRDELRLVKDEMADTVQQHKIEKESLQHLTQMALEKREIDFLKRELKSDATRDKDIAAVRNEYRDKAEKELKAQIVRGDEMYAAILARLPDITAKFKADVG